MTPIGALFNNLSNPIPAKVPPSVGTNILQVVSSAVTNTTIGAEKVCFFEPEV